MTIKCIEAAARLIVAGAKLHTFFIDFILKQVINNIFHSLKIYCLIKIAVLDLFVSYHFFFNMFSSSDYDHFIVITFLGIITNPVSSFNS